MVARALVVFGLALAACRSSNNECSQARRDAAIAVTNAEAWALHDVDKAIAHAAEARAAFDQVRLGVTKLDDKLRLVEESMGCFGAFDCCKQLASYSAEDKYDVYATAMGVWQVVTPVEVEEVITPLKETLNGADHLAQMTPNEAVGWCSSVRTALGKARRLVPSAWTRAMFQASKEVDHANAVVTSEQHRADVIRAWAHSVRTMGHAPAPVLDKQGYLFTHVDAARYRVEHYVETCVSAQVATK